MRSAPKMRTPEGFDFSVPMRNWKFKGFGKRMGTSKSCLRRGFSGRSMAERLTTPLSVSITSTRTGLSDSNEIASDQCMRRGTAGTLP